MRIERKSYLQELERMRHSRFVKIITGIRRCGKSYLLFNLYNDYLLNKGVQPSQIIKIPLDSFSLRELRQPDNLYRYINNKTKNDGMHYIMLDEIQLVENFADVLNEFLRKDNVDIYVTGSNARLLSKDVITEFRGRGHEIRMYPLSFAEYTSVNKSSLPLALDDYETYGGLPQIFDYSTEEEKSAFLKNLLEETYIRDIEERYKVQKNESLSELLDLLASNIGCLTNPKKLADSFNSIVKGKLTRDTVQKYLSYFEDAFLIEKAVRFDIKGKNYINYPLKYYFSDLGLRNARLNFRQIEKTHLMENVVFNELLIRGFNVDVGVVPVRRMDDEGNRTRAQLEIDFVCNKGSKRFYIQSAYALPSEKKIRQEIEPFINVDDAFKKIVVVGNECRIHRDEQGITTMSIFDFLLNKDSLEL